VALRVRRRDVPTNSASTAKRVKVSDAARAALKLKADAFHPECNGAVAPHLAEISTSGACFAATS
jgi:hypothetical protein